MIKHADGTIDKRYTVSLEYCGYAKPRYVARFCGDWLGQRETKTDAWELCQQYGISRGISCILGK